MNRAVVGPTIISPETHIHAKDQKRKKKLHETNAYTHQPINCNPVPITTNPLAILIQ
jgi:hypothetical protein